MLCCLTKLIGLDYSQIDQEYTPITLVWWEKPLNHDCPGARAGVWGPGWDGGEGGGVESELAGDGGIPLIEN